MNKEQLMEFEKDIIKIYEQGKIRGPVHMCGGNEEPLIEIFKKIKKNDWIFSTHRSHYHCLLKSKNPEWVKSEILKGRSLHLNSNKYKIFTSAIVGGPLSIALGVALAIKKKNKNIKLREYILDKKIRIPHIWCFVGDMASEMGIFVECWKYAIGHDLPITFIIEDNELGVCTPTKEVWGGRTPFKKIKRKIIYYKYKRLYPHHGIGKWVTF